MNNLPIVTMGCPVRNRSWILPDYLEHLYNLDYPKKNLIPTFIINDSADDSAKILTKWQEEHRDEYRSIIVNYRTYGQVEDKRTHEVRQKIYTTLSKARNALLEATDALGADYLFSVDSDILVPKNALKTLLEAQKDIVAGRIFNDRSKTYPNFMVNQNGVIVHLLNFPADALFKVDVTGAVYLMSRPVFTKIRYGYDPQGEDIYFCKLAKQNGFKLWVDPTVYCDHCMAPDMLEDIKKRK